MNTLLAIPVSMNFLRHEKEKERKKGKDREEGIRDRERQGKLSWVSLLLKTLILSDQGPTLMTSFNLNYFLGAPISKYSHTWGLGLQHSSLGGHRHSVRNKQFPNQWEFFLRRYSSDKHFTESQIRLYNQAKETSHHQKPLPVAFHTCSQRIWILYLTSYVTGNKAHNLSRS